MHTVLLFCICIWLYGSQELIVFCAHHYLLIKYGLPLKKRDYHRWTCRSHCSSLWDIPTWSFRNLSTLTTRGRIWNSRHKLLLIPLRYRPARLDLHESGTIGKPFKRTSTAICFWFFNFSTEYLKQLKSSEPLHAKLNPISCLFGSRFVCAQAAIFFAKPYSINAGEASIVLWIAARR